MVWYDIGPAAMLYADHVDSISAAGIILAEVWNNKKIVVIDELGSEFLEYVKDGNKIEILEDGTVITEQFIYPNAKSALKHF